VPSAGRFGKKLQRNPSTRHNVCFPGRRMQTGAMPRVSVVLIFLN
jgi:hypothetical protein